MSATMFLRLSIALCLAIGVSGHGRMNNPPSRASMWRFGFDNPEDYNDNEGNCGGFAYQWNQNGGACGTCGDPIGDPQPRDHEGGGHYGNGIITRTYSEGQVIDIAINLTASHKGYFEMRLCPWNNPSTPETQECLDQYLLEVVGTNGGTRYQITTYATIVYNFQVKLPAGVTCEQCVLQWHYRTGNSWGTDPDGTSCTGCGNQETFRACADVAIV